MNELAEFRQTVRAWLEGNAPTSLKGKRGDFYVDFWGGKKTPPPLPDSQAWLDMMAKKGWTVPMWPKEYGGGGLTKEENKIIMIPLVVAIERGTAQTIEVSASMGL